MYLPFKIKKIITILIFFQPILPMLSQTGNNHSTTSFENSFVSINQNDYDKALDEALYSETIGYENKDDLQIAKANYLLAQIFKKRENYEQTIKHAVKSIEFAKKSNAIETEILSTELLAWAYVYVGFYDYADEVLNNIDHLLKNYNGNGKHFFMFKKLYRKASVLRKKNEKQKYILQTYFQALKEINQFHFKNNYQKNESYLSLYNNLGLTYKNINIDSSYVYFQKAYQYKNNNDKRNVADLEKNIAAYYVEKNRNKDAIALLDYSIPTIIKSEHKFLTSESYKVLSEAYKNEGNSAKFSQYNTLYLIYQDSLNIKRNEAINKAIEYIKENEKNQQQEKTNQHLLLYSVIGIVVLIFILLLLFRFSRRKNESKS